MPHDSHGAELRVGDRVTMEFEVIGLFPSPSHCNANLRAIAPGAKLLERETYFPQVTCNAALVTKVVSRTRDESPPTEAELCAAPLVRT